MQSDIPQPLADSLDAFLRSLEGKNRAATTQRAYQADVRHFFTWLSANNMAASSPERIVKADITDYLASLARLGLSGVTRARKLAALREYFRYLVNHGQLIKSPSDGIDTPKREKKSRTALAPSEYNRLLALTGSNPRDFAILQLFLQSGIRISELCALTVSDVDFINHALSVRAGKGLTDRTIGLDKKAAQAVKNYLTARPDKHAEHLFLNAEGKPITPRGVQWLVAKYVKEAGITRKVSPHSLRHTFATEKARRGVSPFLLQAWLGHARLDTTAIYVHMAGGADAQKIMEQTSL